MARKERETSSTSGSSSIEKIDGANSSADEGANSSADESVHSVHTEPEEGIVSTPVDEKQEKLDKVNDVLYGPETQSKAINNLIFYSVLMFTVPFTLMYTLKVYFFEDYLGYDSSTSSLYAGGIAVLAVYIIVAMFIRAAYLEEKRDEQLIAKLK